MSDLKALLDEHIESLSDAERFSGSVLVALDGDVVLSKGYGMANYEFDVPNTPQTVFRIGSLAKPFTSLAIMQLFEKGLIRLDDTIATYLPDYPHGKQVTIHHLLSHTSGIWNYTNAPNFLEACRRYHSVDELIQLFMNAPLDFNPGEKFAYSNSGYILLGKIIEITSGSTYEEYLVENIFNPLGMKHSGYDHSDAIIKHRASGYNDSDSGLKHAEFIDMSVPYSAGGLYSTTEDLYIWEQALYTERLVSNESLSKMFHPYSDEGFGYGWIRMKQDRETVGHSGGIPGFASMLLQYVNDRATVIVLSNILSEVASNLSWKLGELMFANHE